MTPREIEAIFKAVDKYPLSYPFVQRVYEMMDLAGTSSPAQSDRATPSPVADADLDFAATLWLIVRARGLNFVRRHVRIIDEWNLILAPETIH